MEKNDRIQNKEVTCITIIIDLNKPAHTSLTQINSKYLNLVDNILEEIV